MSESTWLERFYTHFLGRDLTYAFAGGLFICVVEYAFYSKVFIPQGISLELIGFILSSYILGSVIRDVGTKIFPSLIKKTHFRYPSHLLFHQDLIKNYDADVLNRYERLMFRLAINTSVGTSSLLSGIIIGIDGFYRWFFQATHSINYIGLSLCLVLLGFFMVYIGISTARELENNDIALTNDIVSKIK
jgi:hypothetical protein